MEYLQIFFLVINLLMYAYSSYSSNVIRSSSLVPKLVIENGEYHRLILHTLCHGNILHLFLNMSILIRLISTLNYRINIIKFMFFLLITYNLVYLSFAFILKSFFNYPFSYYNGCIGFSGLIFGLMYFNGLLNSGRTININGMLIPAQYQVFYTLLFSQIMMPNVSFLGHFSGIIAAGLLLKFSGISFI
jgi:rhomboid domain-containing protein 1